MHKTLEQIWSDLTLQAEQDGSGLFLEQLTRTADVSIFAALNAASKNRGFIVQMPHNLKPENLSRQSSIKLELINDFTGLAPGMSAVGFFLKDDEFSDLFDILVEEIVKETKNALTTEKACSAVVRCIIRWRLFLEKRRLPLSEMEIRGLIGELVVLSKLTKKFDPIVAVSSWRGPYDEVRDFELPDYSVEVKTCVPSEGASIVISRTEQLDTQDIRPVYLAVVTLAKNQTAGLTLCEYIDLASNSLQEPDCAIELADRLAVAGYLPGHSHLYEDRYGMSDFSIYEVRDGFPRIPSFQVPAGVINVKFNIMLSALIPFRVNEALILDEEIRQGG